MREILFRGKRTDNGEWVFGDVFKMRSFSEIQTYISTEPFMLCNDGEFDVMPEVIPETVGQFTGVTDKNGTKIFEGDIVNEYDMPQKISNTGIVKWSSMFMGWHISQVRSMYCHEYMSYEVIGNIHDNPELVQI